jgi:CrcB protein
MGALIGWFARGTLSEHAAESARLLLGVGLLGGFTTFSAFSGELVTMIHRGQMGLAAGYIAASLIAGMAAVIVGLVAVQGGPQ